MSFRNKCRVKMILGIIVTGQLRNFFSGPWYLLKEVIDHSVSVYDKIYLFFVVNDECSLEQLEILFPEQECDLVDYRKYIEEFDKFIDQKLNSTEFLEIKKWYQGTEENSAQKEIKDPDYSIRRFCKQGHQIQIGINRLIEKEKQIGQQFDFVMRTRFDVFYCPDFVPRIPVTNDILEKILFNGINLELYEKAATKHCIKGLGELISFVRQQKIELPNFRIKRHLEDLTMGGTNFYNPLSLENLYNGDENILWCYNDYIIFSQRDNFIKLSSLYDDYGKITPFLNIPHYYAPESQLMMFAIKNNMNPIMFVNNTCTLIERVRNPEQQIY